MDFNSLLLALVTGCFLVMIFIFLALLEIVRQLKRLANSFDPNTSFVGDHSPSTGRKDHVGV